MKLLKTAPGWGKIPGIRAGLVGAVLYEMHPPVKLYYVNECE